MSRFGHILPEKIVQIHFFYRLFRFSGGPTSSAAAALPFKPRAIRSGLFLKIGVIRLLIVLIFRGLGFFESSDPDCFILYLHSGTKDA